MSATPANAYEAAIKQILALMSTTWKCQVLREEQSARINWRDRIESGELTLPFAILTVSKMGRYSGRGASDATLFSVPITITRVEAQTMGKDQVSDVMNRLIALWEALYWQQTSGAQYMLDLDAAAFDTSTESEAQATIIKGSAPLASGQLSITPVIDLTPRR